MQNQLHVTFYHLSQIKFKQDLKEIFKKYLFMEIEILMSDYVFGFF